MSWDSQTLKAMKRIGMRKKSSMHFIVLKVCKSPNVALAPCEARIDEEAKIDDLEA